MSVTNIFSSHPLASFLIFNSWHFYVLYFNFKSNFVERYLHRVRIDVYRPIKVFERAIKIRRRHLLIYNTKYMVPSSNVVNKTGSYGHFNKTTIPIL